MTTHLDTTQPSPMPLAGAQPLPQFTPLRQLLPQLSDAAIVLRNRAYAAAASSLGAGRVLIWQDSGQFATVGELHCRLGGLPFVLAADNLSALEPRLKGFESFVPAEACTALVEHALAPVLQLIEQLAGCPVECEEYRRAGVTGPVHARTRDPEGDDAALRIGFALLLPKEGGDGPTSVRGWIRATPAMWRSFDFSRSPAAPTKRHHTVPIGLSVQLGQCRLPLFELRDLLVGDALRITPRLARQSQGLAVRLVDASGRHSFRARFAGDQLVLETPMSTTLDTSTASLSHAMSAHTPSGLPRGGFSPTMPPPTVAATPGNGAGAEDVLTQVECDLTFELGSMRLTVAEIARLRVGQSLRLGVRLQEQPVRILVSGRQIARGELAAVGDELVVVVTETQGLPAV